MKFDITVIIPVYNASGYIEKTLNSIFNGNKSNIQVIAIDDASIDNSLSILKSYEAINKNIKVLSLEKNHGAGYARNLAINHASGDYMIFFDADDVLYPNAIDRLLNIVKQKQCDLAIYRYHLIKNKKQEKMRVYDLSIWNRIAGCQPVIEIFLKDYPGLLRLVNYPWNKIYNTEFIKMNQIRFSETAVHNDILAHWMSLMLSKSIVFINDYFCGHRIFNHRKQITNINDERRLDIFKVFDDVERFFCIEKNLKKTYYEEFLFFKEELCVWAMTRINNKLKIAFFLKTQWALIEKIDIRYIFIKPKVYLYHILFIINLPLICLYKTGKEKIAKYYKF